MEKTVLPKI